MIMKILRAIVLILGIASVPLLEAGTTVDEINCHIVITLNIEIYGPGASSDLAFDIAIDIESAWGSDASGNQWYYGHCPVDFFCLVSVSDSGGTDSTAHQIEIKTDPSGKGISSVNNPLPQPNGDPGSGTWDNNEPAGTWEHEAGHLMGLGDRYRVISRDPYRTEPVDSTAEGNIMAELDGSPNQAQIDSVIDAAGVTCPWWCCIFLVVDDDGGANYETCYTEVLDSLGIGYELYEVGPGLDGPSLEELFSHVKTLWITGDQYFGTVTETDAINLMTYLSEGNNLIISGQDIGRDIWEGYPSYERQMFYSEFLGAEYIQNSADLWTLIGTEGSFLEELGHVSIQGGDCADNQYAPSEIDPLGDAQSIMHYDTTWAGRWPLSSGTAAVANQMGNMKTIYMAFGFEAVVGLQTRIDMMSTMIDWLVPPGYLCGDATGDDEVTPADGYTILNYLGSGPMPVTCWAANVNGDDVITPSDGYTLLNYLGGGPDLNCAPCEF
jgi:hypothetical protein